VQIDSVRTDSGLVMRVLTKDGWSTKADWRFRSAGGDVEFTIGLVEDNLLGTASSAAVRYRKTTDRTTVALGFRRPRLFAGRVGIALAYEDRSDGRLDAVAVEQPFYSLTSRTGFRVEGEDHDERVLRFFDGMSRSPRVDVERLPVGAAKPLERGQGVGRGRLDRCQDHAPVRRGKPVRIVAHLSVDALVSKSLSPRSASARTASEERRRSRFGVRKLACTLLDCCDEQGIGSSVRKDKSVVWQVSLPAQPHPFPAKRKQACALQSALRAPSLLSVFRFGSETLRVPTTRHPPSARKRKWPNTGPGTSVTLRKVPELRVRPSSCPT
jgi:hypothetical protein